MFLKVDTTLNNNKIASCLKKTSQLISGSKWFTVVISILEGVIKKGIKSPIQMFTTSSNGDNSIIYDSNEVLVIFGISPPPNQNLNISVESDPSSAYLRGNLGAQEKVNLDIDPKVKITEGGSFVIRFTNKDYKFGSGCINTDKVCPKGLTNCFNIKKLLDNQFHCSVSPNELNIKIPYNLTNEHFRISFDMINPNFQSGNTELIITFKSNIIDYIFDIKNSGVIGVLKKVAIKSKILYSCGYNKNFVKDKKDLFIHDGLFNQFHNSVKVVFSLSQTLGNGDYSYSIKTAKGYSILTGSIYYDFPAGSKPIKCHVKTLNEIPWIICDNVGVLVRNKNYKFGAKIFVNSMNSLDDFLALHITTLVNKEVASVKGEAVMIKESKNIIGTNWENKFGKNQVISRLGKLESVKNMTDELNKVNFNKDYVGVKVHNQEQGLIIGLTKDFTCVKDANKCQTTITKEQGYSILMNLLIPISPLGLTSENLVKGIIPGLSFFGGSTKKTCAENKHCKNYGETSNDTHVNNFTSGAVLDGVHFAYLKFTCELGKEDTAGNCFSLPDINSVGKTSFESGSVFGIPKIMMGNYNGMNQYPDENLLEFQISFSYREKNKPDWISYDMSLIQMYTIHDAMLTNKVRLVFIIK